MLKRLRNQINFYLAQSKKLLERKDSPFRYNKQIVKISTEGGEINMNKKLILLGTTTLVLGGLVLSSSAVKAYRGDPNVQGPNCTAERHEAMTEAFENKDYNAWKELMQGKGRVTQVVNEGNFARFAEMHNLMLQGKTEEASQIRTELGLGLKNGSGQGQGQRAGYGKNTNR